MLVHWRRRLEQKVPGAPNPVLTLPPDGGYGEFGYAPKLTEDDAVVVRSMPEGVVIKDLSAMFATLLCLQVSKVFAPRPRILNDRREVLTSANAVITKATVSLGTPQSVHFPLSSTFPQVEWRRSHSGFHCRSAIPRSHDHEDFRPGHSPHGLRRSNVRQTASIGVSATF